MLRARLEAMEAAASQVRPAPRRRSRRFRNSSRRSQRRVAGYRCLNNRRRPPRPNRSTPARRRPDEPRPPIADGRRPLPGRSRRPGPGFEERIGTQWVVWIGGLRWRSAASSWCAIRSRRACSGPACAIVLGGALALALLAAGEWTRRKESISAIDGAADRQHSRASSPPPARPSPMPTVYAAYALYGFLAPATAFILLGLVALAHARRGAAAWAGARRSRRRRRLRDAAPGLLEAAGLLGAVHLSCRRHRGRASRWRASGCGAGSRSPPSSSRCCGPSRACECGPSMLGPHAFHVVADLCSRR